MTDKTKPCAILCAGEINDYEFLRSRLSGCGFLICADGGFRHAKQLDISPDMLVGDFDSLPFPGEYSGEILQSAAEKDETDAMLAVQAAIRRGFRDIILLGATGGRLDHTYANFQTIVYAARNGVCAKLVDERHTVLFVEDGAIFVPRQEPCYLSVFAYGGPCSGVTLEGVKYPLLEANLTPEFPLGVSNEFRSDPAKITVRSGSLLVMISRK